MRKGEIDPFSFSISKWRSYVWLRDFLILQADTGVPFTKFGIFAWRTPHGATIPRQTTDFPTRSILGSSTAFSPTSLRRAPARGRRHLGEIAAAIAAKSFILAVAAPAQLLIAAVRLIRQTTRENISEPHGRNRPQAGVNLRRRRLVSLTALSSWTLLAYCVTDDNFTHFTERVDDDRLRVRPDVAQLRDLPGVNAQLFGGVRSACDGDDHRRRLVSR